MAPKPITKNTLFYGDNLDILKEYIPDESVDLIYLDPPFNSNRNYNVLFKDESGRESEAQVTAFKDTWHWDEAAASTYHDLVTDGASNVSSMIGSLHEFIGENQMMAYLVMMAARLAELRRVLKSTGSLYLHCDPTASHYLKVILDTIFGPRNFINEIVWKRSHPHGNVSRSYGAIHDVIFFYSKTDKYTWNKPHKPYLLPDGTIDPELIEELYKQYSFIEESTGRRFQATSLLNPASDRPNLTYEFHGHTKVWRWTKERMERAEREGKLYIPKDGVGIAREKRYLDEQEGFPLQDLWYDIPLASALERLGYPTQKPLGLLERIIEASSGEDGVVLDPFCGCGTAIAAAQKMGRKWIGIDVTHLSIALLKNRFKDMYNLIPDKDYEVIGEPEDMGGARELAAVNKYQFQWWALSLIQARPQGADNGSKTGKKGADKGIDGIITFVDEANGKPKRVLAQVKGGANIKSGDIRDLRGTVEREGAAIGVFITLEEPTRDMVNESVSAGFYVSPGWGKKYPRIQIYTVEELMRGATVKMPPQHGTFKQAQRVKDTTEAAQHTFDID